MKKTSTINRKNQVLLISGAVISMVFLYILNKNGIAITMYLKYYGNEVHLPKGYIEGFNFYSIDFFKAGIIPINLLCIVLVFLVKLVDTLFPHKGKINPKEEKMKEGITIVEIFCFPFILLGAEYLALLIMQAMLSLLLSP